LHFFSAYPFLRLMLPFLAGLIFTLIAGFTVPVWTVCVAFALAAFIALLPGMLTARRTLFMASADLFFFLFAAALVPLRDLRNDPAWYGSVVTHGRQVVVASIGDIPASKEKTIKLSLRVLGISSDTGLVPSKGKLIAYVQKSRIAEQLRAGETVLFSAALQAPKPPMNPGEFDYRQYLSDRGVHFTAYVDSAHVTVLSLQAGINPLWAFGLSCKQALLNTLAAAGLTPDAEAISAALLTGYDAEIGDDVRNAFAHSGTLHVLSVSGLHTGLIYLVIGYLFDLLDRRRARRITRFAIVTVGLWLFALITGFAAPVLRAVIMFNLLGAGRLFVRQGSANPLNLLFASAFLLLCYDPLYIRDVGFQLSYCAMIGLLSLQPWMSQWWTPAHPILVYTWQSVTASAAATLTTLPLTLCYFKQFPVWFFVCNLVVVPLSFVILMLAFTLLFNTAVVPWVINKLVAFLVAFINAFDSPVFGYINDINFNIADACLMAILLLLICYSVAARSARGAVATLAVVVMWQFTGIFSAVNDLRSAELVVFHAGKASVCAVRSGRIAMVRCSDSSMVAFHARPMLIDRGAVIRPSRFNHVSFPSGKVIILAARGEWPGGDLSSVTTLVISNGVVPDSSLMRRLTALKTVVCDGSNKAYAVKTLRKNCEAAGLTFYDTSESGAYLAEIK
jgi:competence protein ComEC